MKPAGFDLIENMIIPTSPPGTFRVFAVIFERPDDFGILKVFLNKSAAEKLLAEIEEYPAYPTAWLDQMLWRKEHPAGPDARPSDKFWVQDFEVAG